jgi:hypothetical protein
VSLVHERTIPTKRQPLDGEVSANSSAGRGCHVVSATDPHGHILEFLDRINFNHHEQIIMSPALFIMKLK